MNRRTELIKEMYQLDVEEYQALYNLPPPGNMDMYQNIFAIRH